MSVSLEHGECRMFIVLRGDVGDGVPDEPGEREPSSAKLGTSRLNMARKSNSILQIAAKSPYQFDKKIIL